MKEEVGTFFSSGSCGDKLWELFFVLVDCDVDAAAVVVVVVVAAVVNVVVVVASNI